MGKFKRIVRNVGLGLAGIVLYGAMSLSSLAQSAHGRIIESGTNDFGVPQATVKVFYNGSSRPSVGLTDSHGDCDITLTDIKAPESPQRFSSLEAVVGPNPGSSQNVTVGIPKAGHASVVVYDVGGREVRKVFDDDVLAGKYNFYWDGKNSNSVSVSAGVYLYVINTNGKSIAKKGVILNNGVVANPGMSYTLPSENNAASVSKNVFSWNSTSSNLRKAAGTVHVDSVEVSGNNMETTVKRDFSEQSGESYDLGTIAAEGNRTLTGFAYNLDTKFTSMSGIEGLVVSLEATPEKTVQTDANGNFSLKTSATGDNQILIRDNTYYNWKHPINIAGSMNVTAFNDTTGIPMIERKTYDNTYTWLDTTTHSWLSRIEQDDKIEYLQYITDVNYYTYSQNGFPQEYWKYDNTVPTFQTNTINVFTNRSQAPSNAYADSLLKGCKGWEDDTIKVVEVSDSSNAQVTFYYDNINLGNGYPGAILIDENGSYRKNWMIRFSNNIPNEIITQVASHEFGHAIFSSGELSKYISDIMYGGPDGRYTFGFRNLLSEKEGEVSYLLAVWKNAKWLEYSK